MITSVEHLRIESRAIFASLGRDASIRRRIRPNNVIAVIWIIRCIIITKFLNDISEGIVFPANENIAIAVIGVNNILHAAVIRLAAGSINSKA